MAHEYAVIGGRNRSIIGRWIYAIAAALSAGFVLLILSIFDVATKLGIGANLPPTVFAIVSAGAIYKLIYWWFAKYGWRVKPIASLLGTPDLNGSWSCTAVSSHTTPEYPDGYRWSGSVIICQTWDTINITMQTNKSASDSLTASMIPVGYGEYKLLYHYRNDPTTFEDGLNAHHGAAELRVTNELSRASGNYFTGRGRSSYGTMYWERCE